MDVKTTDVVLDGVKATILEVRTGIIRHTACGHCAGSGSTKSPCCAVKAGVSPDSVSKHYVVVSEDEKSLRLVVCCVCKGSMLATEKLS